VDEVGSELEDLVAEYPTRPAFRGALAQLEARRGRPGEAARIVGELAPDDFAALPFDQEWLYGMSLLSETSSLLEDRQHASVLYRLLAPWSALNAADHPEGFTGPVSRSLGVLATTLERWAEAERHFEDAMAKCERMGARPWLALTKNEYSKMLLSRAGSDDRARAAELRRAAEALADEIGMRLPERGRS
jgi:hypothetical protein